MIIYEAPWGLLSFLTGIQDVARSEVTKNTMVAFLMIFESRIFAQWLLGKRYK